MLSKSSVKYIQSLYHKKFRDEAGCFVAEGPKLVSELLATTPALVKALYGVKNWLNNNDTLLKNLNKGDIYNVEPFELEKISALSTPNQVLAVVQKIPFQSSNVTGVQILLDDIQDPGNLGTIIRTADWFGIKKIICSNATADLYNSKVIQSTMGSILRVQLEYTDLVSWCSQNSHIKIYAAALKGRSVYDCNPEENMALLIGNESKGVREELLNLATQKITIPGNGLAESLNAAVATGIILSHLSK